jgi:hypothetical protein
LSTPEVAPEYLAAATFWANHLPLRLPEPEGQPSLFPTAPTFSSYGLTHAQREAYKLALAKELAAHPGDDLDQVRTNGNCWTFEAAIRAAAKVELNPRFVWKHLPRPAYTRIENGRVWSWKNDRPYEALIYPEQ